MPQAAARSKSSVQPALGTTGFRRRRGGWPYFFGSTSVCVIWPMVWAAHWDQTLTARCRLLRTCLRVVAVTATLRAFKARRRASSKSSGRGQGPIARWRGRGGLLISTSAVESAQPYTMDKRTGECGLTSGRGSTSTFTTASATNGLKAK